MTQWRAAVLVAAVLFVATPPVAFGADARGEAKKWVEFGIAVAERGLWKEAIYRWEKATELDPTYPAAFNNLAVGYEKDGQMEKARQAYEKAMALAPKDQQIRQ